MKVRLELAHKKAKVKKVLLTSDTVIGRSTECGLRIASNEVSRQHCKICIGEDGVTVRDLGSSNGTFVNGYQLEPETDYEIAPDSELSLGGIKFFVRFTEAAGKVMQTDGLGSTVDLKPHQHEALAETAVVGRVEEEMEFAEAETEEPAEETPAEAQADSDSGTVQMTRPADLDSSAPAESDVEMSATRRFRHPGMRRRNCIRRRTGFPRTSASRGGGCRFGIGRTATGTGRNFDRSGGTRRRDRRFGTGRTRKDGR